MNDQTSHDGRDTPVPDDGFEWMLIEIFGHRRHAGRVREEERFGTKMCRIDVPKVEWQPTGEDGKQERVITGWTTHWYGGSSIFSATLTDEASVLRAEGGFHAPSRLTFEAEDDAEFDERPF